VVLNSSFEGQTRGYFFRENMDELFKKGLSNGSLQVRNKSKCSWLFVICFYGSGKGSKG